MTVVTRVRHRCVGVLSPFIYISNSTFSESLYSPVYVGDENRVNSTAAS